MNLTSQRSPAGVTVHRTDAFLKEDLDEVDDLPVTSAAPTLIDLSEQGVILEGDGYEHHSGVEEFEAERERNNLLTASGFFVLHWTWRALHDRPMELLNQLLATLNSRRR